MVANITDGVVPKAQVTIRLEPGDLAQKPMPEGTVEGRFDVPRPDRTLLRDDAAAHGGRRQRDVHRPDHGLCGRRRAASARSVLDKGSVVINGIGIKGRDTTPLEVTAEINSSIDAALALIDQPAARASPPSSASTPASDLRPRPHPPRDRTCRSIASSTRPTCGWPPRRSCVMRAFRALAGISST